MSHERVRSAADAAGRRIPPLWPLASSVAVNPFLGHTGEPLWVAAAQLARGTGTAVTMPRSWYRDRIASGSITDEDLQEALADAPAALRPADCAALKAALGSDGQPVRAVPTVASLCAAAAGIDWPSLIIDRFTAWVAGYFDEGQAHWAAPSGGSALALWRSWAIHDLTPEIAGLSGFARHVSDAPDGTLPALARATARLGLGPDALESYFHQMLLSLGGWAQYARYRVWQSELAGGSDGILRDLLAIRVIWEEALFARYKGRSATPGRPSRPSTRLLLSRRGPSHRQHSTGRCGACRATPHSRDARRCSSGCRGRTPGLAGGVLHRRAVGDLPPCPGESGSRHPYLGFAGFFGLPTAHRPFASDIEERRLPVLLNPSLHTCASGPGVASADQAARVAARSRRAWGRFRQAAVSSFAFVEAAGPLYLGKLLSDSLGLTRTPTLGEPAPRLDPALDLSSRVAIASNVLRAMSLTLNYAPVVLLVGHGANVVNNPHASALHCGACGGYSGEVNARLLAQLLNEAEVRIGLRETRSGCTARYDLHRCPPRHDDG